MDIIFSKLEQSLSMPSKIIINLILLMEMFQKNFLMINLRIGVILCQNLENCTPKLLKDSPINGARNAENVKVSGLKSIAFIPPMNTISKNVKGIKIITTTIRILTVIQLPTIKPKQHQQHQADNTLKFLIFQHLILHIMVVQPPSTITLIKIMSGLNHKNLTTSMILL